MVVDGIESILGEVIWEDLDIDLDMKNALDNKLKVYIDHNPEGNITPEEVREIKKDDALYQRLLV